jgi:hypothetical protein
MMQLDTALRSAKSRSCAPKAKALSKEQLIPAAPHEEGLQHLAPVQRAFLADPAASTTTRMVIEMGARLKTRVMPAKPLRATRHSLGRAPPAQTGNSKALPMLESHLAPPKTRATKVKSSKATKLKRVHVQIAMRTPSIN